MGISSPDRDPDLPHQVVLVVTHNGQFIEVTCNCRTQAKMKTIGTTNNFWETRELFNDPDNHVRTLTGEAFTEKYTLKFKGGRDGQRGKGIQQGSAQRGVD